MTGKCENPFVNHLVEFCRIACDVHYMHSLRKVKKNNSKFIILDETMDVHTMKEQQKQQY